MPLGPPRSNNRKPPSPLCRRPAIALPRPVTDEQSAADAQTLTLGALGWLLGDDNRAQRLLDLTGLTPDELRANLGALGTQLAVLDFLMAHEPDLIGAADALGVPPERLVAARSDLARERDA